MAIQKQQEITVADALSIGYSSLLDLRDEVQEVCDNAPESLQSSARIETLSESASYLNFADDEPELENDALASHRFNMPLLKAKRNMSRRVRRDNAVLFLQCARDAIESWSDEHEQEERSDEVQELMDKLDDDISNAESCEFPGMMG